MERYGWYEFDSMNAEANLAAEVSQLLPQLYGKAQQAPDAFISQLATAVLPRGGWAIYGGERCVKDVVGMHSRHPDFLRMLDAAMTFIRSQSYGHDRVPQYEIEAWHELHPGESW